MIRITLKKISMFIFFESNVSRANLLMIYAIQKIFALKKAWNKKLLKRKELITVEVSHVMVLNNIEIAILFLISTMARNNRKCNILLTFVTIFLSLGNRSKEKPF